MDLPLFKLQDVSRQSNYALPMDLRYFADFLNPIFFAFKVKDVKQAVRDISEVALRRIVGNMTFDYVLSNREMLAANTQREVQESLDRYQAGVKIVTVQLQDVNPPEHVKPSFNEVNEADQDMKRLVNEAEEAYNREVPKARGDAKKMLEEKIEDEFERIISAEARTAYPARGGGDIKAVV